MREALLLPFKQGPTVLLAGAVVFVPGVVLTVLVARLFPGFAPLSGQISGRAMLSSLVVAFPAALTLGIYAATVSLAVADRLGGRKTPFYRYPLWLLTLPRPLVASIVVAAGITALGVPFLLLPGLVLLVLFAFVPFVALFDLEPPATALRRSLRLAGACAGRLGLVCALGLALGWGAWALGGAVAGSVPALVQVAATGLLLLLCAYFPVGAAFLLYLDVKRAQEGFGDVELQAALEAVRPAREPEPVGQTG